jgi:hypothetical protein
MNTNSNLYFENSQPTKNVESPKWKLIAMAALCFSAGLIASKMTTKPQQHAAVRLSHMSAKEKVASSFATFDSFNEDFFKLLQMEADGKIGTPEFEALENESNQFFQSMFNDATADAVDPEFPQNIQDLITTFQTNYLKAKQVALNAVRMLLTSQRLAAFNKLTPEQSKLVNKLTADDEEQIASYISAAVAAGNEAEKWARGL